jgi:predicted dinucleotide-binding enzyme
MTLLAGSSAHKTSTTQPLALYAARVERDAIGVAGLPLKVQAALYGAARNEERSMKLGIIGAGSLGAALGERFAQRGHAIMFGGGASAQDAALRLKARVGSNSETAAFGDVVILAVPFAAIDGALADAGSLRGRVVWSCVNALRPDYTGLAIGFDNSAAEEVARAAPGARVVAAVPPFANAIARGELGYDHGLEPTVFACGDDAVAKRVVGGLVRELGAHPVDAGPLKAARLVEPAMMLAVSIAYGGVPRDVALRLLERGGVASRPEGTHT